MKEHERRGASDISAIMIVIAVACLVVVGCETPDTSEGGEKPRGEKLESNLDEQTAETTERDGMELPDDFDIQGHRGARGLKPENTLPGFEAALDLEVDTLELDVHLSRDDRIVIWHDPYVYESKCMSTAAKTPLQLRPTREGEETNASLVRSLATGLLGRFRCKKNPEPERFPDQDSAPTELAGDDYRIVELVDLFAFVDRYAASEEKSKSQRKKASEVRFNIETKRDAEHPEYIGDDFDGTSPGVFEEKLVEAIRKHDLVDRVTVQSFVPASLWAVHELEPELRLAVLEKERHESLEHYAKKGASVWSPRASLVDEKAMEEARKAGLEVKPWTVNDPSEMRRLIELGVDGIITDRPDLLTKHR